MTDEQLVGALQQGDRDSLGLLVQRWERPLFRFVFRMLPKDEDAADICQETFLRVYRKADRFQDGSRFSTWMYQIALNLCRDKLRRKQRWNKILPPRWVGDSDDESGDRLERFAGSDDPEATVGNQEQSVMLRRAMKQIPAEQREVLVMKEYEGLKFREIAEILGCPESTVKSRMYYGLKGLKQILADERPGSGRAS